MAYNIEEDPGMVSPEEFNVIQRIGRGGFAEVFLVERKTDKKQFVVKKIDLEFVADQGEDILKLAKQEASIQLRHPNIVSVFSSFQERFDLSIVMEYCAGGDLQRAIADNKRTGEFFPELKIVNWTLQLSLSLKYLHDQHILHRDVTAKNVFLTADRRVVKLGDFGIAKIIDRTGSGGTTQVCNPMYASPEFCDGKPYNAKSEAWSLGVLIYNLAALQHPFNFDGQNLFPLYRAITELPPKPLPDHFSTELGDLVSKLMEKNPEQRLYVADAVTHPFLLSAITNLCAHSELDHLQLPEKAFPEPNDSPQPFLTMSSIHGCNDVFEAAAEGYLDVVKYFVKTKKVNVNAKDDEFGRTPLHHASSNGHLQVVKWLIKTGADVAAQSNDNDRNDTPIHLASSLPVARYLIEEVDAAMSYWKNGKGQIPMIKAAISGKIDVVKYFIKTLNVSIEVREDRFGRTALHYASSLGHLEVVKWLIQSGANVKSKSADVDNNQLPIHLAASFGHLMVVRYFIEEVKENLTFKKNRQGDTPMMRAALSGQLDVVTFFLSEKKSNITKTQNRYGRTALHHASSLGHLEIVKLLVRAGANVKAITNDSDDNDMPIHFAAEFGHLSVVRYYIEEVDAEMIFSKNRQGDIPMLRAAIGGKLDIVKYFIVNRNVGIDVIGDRLGRTALHYAGGLGHLDVVKWLVQAGGNVRATSNYSDDSNLPIHIAAIFGHLAVVKFLIDEVDGNLAYLKNRQGDIAMLRAALGGHLDVVKFFISDKNVSIEAKEDRFGRTALHKASQEGHLKVVEWLINAGANAQARSNNADNNIMPIHIAAIAGKIDVVKYFVQHFPRLQFVKDSLGRSPLDMSEIGENSRCKEVHDFLNKLASISDSKVK